MPGQRYSVNDRRKDFMIYHNESDLHRPGIEPGSPDSLSNSLPIELTETGYIIEVIEKVHD
jgi:hypothetical protein